MPDKKPNPFLEFLVGAVTGAIATVGESKLEAVLDQLHKDDPESYKAAVAGGHALVTKLQPLVQKSATPIDDAVLSAIGQAIDASAAKNGITL